MASTDSRPLPLKNTAFRLYFTAYDSSGVPVTAFTSPDSELSKDGGAYADATNEATYVGHGQGYIDLTSGEMNYDHVGFYFSCTEGSTRECISICPAQNGSLPVNVVQCGGSTVAAGAIPNVAAGASGGLPLSVDASGRVDVLKINGTSQTARDLGASVLISSGTGTGQLSVTSGVIQSSVATIQATPLGAIADSVLDEDLSTHTTAGTLGQMQTDVYTGVGAIAGTTLPAIKLQTDKIPASPASTTNITAGTITTVTNLTNAPTNGDFTTTMKASVTAAVPTAAEIRAEIDTNSTKLDVATSTRLATASYTAPPSAASVADAVCDEAVSDHTTAGSVGAQLASIYAAQIDFSDDEANTQDEYSVQWFKNGAPVTSGVTSPTIQVIKRADGTDLVASAAMTQIGSTGAYKYDEATNRITSGEAVLVQVQATIDGSARTWRKVISRDST